MTLTHLADPAVRTCTYAQCTNPGAITLDGYVLCRWHQKTHAEDFDPAALDAADRAERTVTTAMRLVAAVHGWRSEDVDHLVTGTDDLAALVVVLAAMVDPTADRQQLLDWTCRPPKQRRVTGCDRPSRHRLRQHRANGEHCGACEQLERDYQAENHRAQQAARGKAVAS